MVLPIPPLTGGRFLASHSSAAAQTSTSTTMALCVSPHIAHTPFATPHPRASAQPNVSTTMALCAPPHIVPPTVTAPLGRVADQPITAATTHPRFEAQAPFLSLYNHAADHDPGGVTGTLVTRGGTNAFPFRSKASTPSSLSTGQAKKGGRLAPQHNITIPLPFRLGPMWVHPPHTLPKTYSYPYSHSPLNTIATTTSTGTTL